MTTSAGNQQIDNATLRRAPREPASGRAGFSSPNWIGQHGCSHREWTVVVCLGKRLITREVTHAGKPWGQDEEPEVIWPTWPATPAEETAASASPLAELQQYWTTTGNRLRDSAKWMAAVLGAALATVVGTSPLCPHEPSSLGDRGRRRPRRACLPEYHDAPGIAGHAPAGGVLLRYPACQPPARSGGCPA